MAALIGFGKLLPNRLSKAHICLNQVRWRFKRPDTPEPLADLAEKVLSPRNKNHMEREMYPGEHQEEYPKGKIYDKKPFKLLLEEGKKYAWCSCGQSKTQPLCDGHHKKIEGTTFIKTTPKYRPIRFIVEETKEYWLCNCKQSSNRPYCDGTHKRQDIQDAIKT